MEGVRYVTDEAGKRVAVVLDLKTHGELWKDMEDVLVSHSRKRERSIPLEEARAELIRRGKLDG
ncbi:MAG: hypothetical protein GC160_18305 [Acidobacteria bacterium]|nr:hypothetical protein [Acidobacteriota bacterium]